MRPRLRAIELIRVIVDYTDENVSVQNLIVVILGDKNKVKGGSGKVINSKLEDKIFISTLIMEVREFLVIYAEACDIRGSMFEGMMPKDLKIYATTASNAQENSWGTYCLGMDPSPPPEYIICLGDLYSVAWMEDKY
ncbi:hypothetical protein JHK85_009773 [Glycine max]|nr:hypothetical protein JHK85_009773 [Glycine max]KAG5065786.1 hypothetical protein JHK86_009517 [Glycine max]